MSYGTSHKHCAEALMFCRLPCLLPQSEKLTSGKGKDKYSI